MADDSQSCDTPLHTAASRGNLDEVRELLKTKQYEVNARNSHNQTSLHLACANGHLDTVWTLANDFVADIGAIDNGGNTPMLFAAKNKHVQIIIMLNLLSMCGKCLSDGVRLPCSFSRSQTDSHHVKIFEDIFFEYYNDSKAVEKTMLMISKFFSDYNEFKHFNDEGFFTLLVAASLGLTNLINRLVSGEKMDINMRGFHGLSVLHCACFGGHVLLVESLISEYGIDPLVKDKNEQSILHFAAMAGHVETMRHLVSKHNADMDCTDYKNSTPLMLAVAKGHAHVLDVLVKEFNNDCHVRGFNGCTLLHYACTNGHIELIDKLVVEYGFDPADGNDIGATPLHIAAARGNVEAVRHLISKHSADNDYTANDNITPLMVAALCGHVHVLDVLVKEFNSNLHIQDINGYTLLHYACKGGHIELIDKLVMEYGFDPTNRDNNGDTPLHIAAAKGRVETVRHLISKHNADIDSINNSNKTPLMLAVLNGHVNVLDALVKEFNSNRHICCGNKDRTLLHQTCKYGHIELMDKLVLEYGFDPTDRDNNGDTPLHIAAATGHVEAVRHLISMHRADIHCTNNDSSTPLMLAALNGYMHVLNVLVKEFNSNCHVRGYNGYTLLHYTCQGGHVELIDKLVMEYGLDFANRDDDGNTPLHIAAMKGHVETVRHLITQHKVLTKHFVRNKDGKTALDLAKAQKNQKMITIFRNLNQFQSTYQQLVKLAKQEFGNLKYLTRIFVVGHSDAGKSTLIETIKKESLISYFSTSTVAPHTAGIVPSTYDSNTYGRMILYDFAGDSEYYSSHAAIMESINTSKGNNIYLILCDLSKGEEAAVTKYSYWLSFLSYNIKQFSNTIILPVGSHADATNKSSVEKTLRVLDSISQKFCSNFKIDHFHIEQSVALDCRKRGAIVNGIKELTNRFSKVPIRLSSETSTLLGLLKKDFEHVPACKVSLLISHIEETGIPLPLNSSSLYFLIRELHDLGLLMVIDREGDSIENHIIILKISTFTSDVHNKLFSKSAIADLTKHIDQLKFSIGIIPESLLERVLPEYITKESLLKLQYCHEIEKLYVEKDHTLSQLTSVPVPTEGSTKEKSHLFFPALCDLKLEDIQWPKSEGDKITLGWYAKCDGDRFDFFPTRFLHVLIVNLSHNFALKQSLPTRHRLSTTASDSLIAEVHAANPRCHVWSTGLHWLMKNGVEVFVDMPKYADSKELIVLARSNTKNQVECAITLQLVI
ncbi:ankyrin-1-like isoform X1 [Halichondria panicea]|uniref:ankyrin-1-like isoform X1 n=2 Tax=Halichondria panicea TaxID=6063 RepID=UPI00312B52D7